MESSPRVELAADAALFYRRSFWCSAWSILAPYINPAHIRIGVGLVLIVYSTYNLARPALAPIKVNRLTDIGIGFLNGLLGGLTGLGGVIVTIWCQLRGGSKDAQRAVFQPVIFATMTVTTVTFAVAGHLFSTDVIKLFSLGLPALLFGLWAGNTLYGKLDDAAFRKAILILLLVSGTVLVVPALIAQEMRTSHTVSLRGDSQHGGLPIRRTLDLASQVVSKTSTETHDDRHHT